MRFEERPSSASAMSTREPDRIRPAAPQAAAGGPRGALPIRDQDGARPVSTSSPLRAKAAVAAALAFTALAGAAWADTSQDDAYRHGGRDPILREPREEPDQGDGRVSAFYSWKGRIPQTPGRLLRSEPLPPLLGLANAAQQARILYTSTDGVTGQGIVVVSGAVFLPKGRAPRGGWPIIAWAHGTVGVADICAPSWAGRSYRDVRYLNTWLEQGYAVVATDYQGLGTPGPHPYLQTRPEAYSVLDSVRALLDADAGLANKVVVVGQSQGGGAAFATAGFAPAYAPRLNLLGTVATGTPNLTLAQLTAPSAADPNAPDPTLAYAYYLALMALQITPGLDPARIFTPLALPLLDQARTSCVLPLEGDVMQLGLTRTTALQPGFGSVLVGPVVQSLLYPTLRLKAPVFMGVGGKDLDVSPGEQVALARAACAAGSAVELRVYPDQDHGGTVNASLADSVPFVRKVMAGEPVASMCPSSP